MRTPTDVLRSLKRFCGEVLDETGDDWDTRLAEEEGVFERPFAMVWAASPAVLARGVSRVHIEYLQPFVIHAYPAPGDDASASISRALVIERALDDAFSIGGGALPVPEAPVAAAQAAEGDLLAGAYRYRLTSVGWDTSESAPSPAVSITTPSTGAVALSWPTTNGARGYRVYRGPSNNERLLASVLDGSYVDRVKVALHPTKAPPSSGTLAHSGGPRRVPLYRYDDVGILDPASERGSAEFARIQDLDVHRVRDTDDPTLYTVVSHVRLGWRRRGAVPSGENIAESVTSAYETTS